MNAADRYLGKYILRVFRLSVICFAFLLLFFPAGSACAQAAGPAKHGMVEHVTVHGKSLEGNLEGDSADREVSVYLPPSYAVDRGRRYAVVYLLHGFTDTDATWFGSKPKFADGAAAAERAFSGNTREMIIVMPNAFTRYFGSMYSNSATTGDWEDFLAHDLVAYIDSHYRTIPDRRSRGLSGHSMGGYGTIRMGMKHPEVFSSIYALSACCLTPNPNLQDSSRAEVQGTVSDEELAKADFLLKASFATAAAWSPDPANPPRFLDMPWKSGNFQQSVADRWAANAPTVMVDQYVPNLRSLHAIAFDVGTRDGLKPGAEKLDEILTAYGIAHAYETYDGDHLSGIEKRFEKKVLPFFALNLSCDEDIPQPR